MDFFIKVFFKRDKNETFGIRKWSEASNEKLCPHALHLVGADRHTTVEDFKSGKRRFCIIGDPVYHDRANALTYLEKEDIGNFIRNVDGFYYLISWDDECLHLSISSSIFGIIPVFYMQDGESVLISSSLDLIRTNANQVLKSDEQYFLEKALFNYPFLDRTPVEQIKLLPANWLIEIEDKIILKRHTFLTDYYTSNPSSWRKSLDSLSDLFIQQAKPFIPDESFVATLTGGLDGRTLVGLSLWLGKQFSTYSYGTENMKDVQIPRKISRLTGIPYNPLIIDDKYTETHFWNYGRKFLMNTYGYGNFTRAHYSYATDQHLTGTKYLVSGNFGSENFRSMKIPGVMTTAILYSIFESSDSNSISQSIESYPGVHYLADRIKKQCIEGVLHSINEFLRQLPSGLTTNQKFYIYLYEHVFPKYFGPEIVYQRNHFNHRAPFLSFGFIKELLKTGLAGVNSDYMESNPFKRYHGQILYSHIIRKTYPDFLHLKLDKGYKPVDFLTIAGPVKIAFGYMQKKFLNRFQAELADYSHQNIISNLNKMKMEPVNPETFNVDHFSGKFSDLQTADMMHFTNMLSSSLYYNYLFNEGS